MIHQSNEHLVDAIEKFSHLTDGVLRGLEVSNLSTKEKFKLNHINNAFVILIDHSFFLFFNDVMKREGERGNKERKRNECGLITNTEVELDSY